MMKKTRQYSLVALVLCGAALVAVWVFRRGDDTTGLPFGKRSTAARTGEVAVPPAPEPPKLSTLEFETVEVWEEAPPSQQQEAAEPKAMTVAKTVSAARVGPDQVLAIVNGRPLTGRALIPPTRFKKHGTAVIPTDVLQEVLDRSIQQELIFQQAESRGLVLGEREQAQLDAMYQHLTSNPLDLPEGVTVTDFGDKGDAAFHVREQAARILQVGLLREAGQEDTADARLAMAARMRGEAQIETVDLALPEAEAPEAKVPAAEAPAAEGVREEARSAE